MPIAGRAFRFVFLSVLLVSVPASAGTCSDLLSSFKKYAREVRETRGARLLARKAPAGEEHERWFGFVSENGRPRPFHGLGHVLIDLPSDALVRSVTGGRKRATFWSKLPALLGWALLAQVYVIDPATDQVMESRIQSEVRRNAGWFDELIQSDFRFESIRKRLASGELSPAEAEREAYIVSRAYASYYKYRDARHGHFTKDDEKPLLHHYLFAHLKPVMEGVVQMDEDFRPLPGFRSVLSEAKKQELLKLTHALYLEYQIIEAYTSSGSPVAGGGSQVQANPLSPFFAEVAADPFTQKLEALRDSGRITRGQFHHALQEHAFWIYRLKCYAIIEVQRLEGGQPVTIEDYDRELLADMGVAN